MKNSYIQEFNKSFEKENELMKDVIDLYCNEWCNALIL
jgi:hypothetical protein